MPIGLVNMHCLFEAFIDLLGKTDLFFGYQLVGQAFRLGALSSFLGLRADNLLGRDSPLGWRKVALLDT